MKFIFYCLILFNSFFVFSQNYIFSHLSSGFDEWPYCSASTPDSGFVIAGYTKETSQNWALYVLKYNKNGGQEWSYRYDGSTSKKDLVHDIIVSSDSGFILAGRTWSFLTMGGDSYIIKLDKNGNHLFTTIVDGKSTRWYNAGLSVDETTNGDIIQTGMYHMAYNPVRYDWEINRFSSSGNHLSSFFIGFTDGNEYAIDVLAIDSNEYLVGGFTETTSTGEDFGFFHADSNDSNLYFANYSGPGDERCLKIIRNSDNSYYLAGYTDSYGAGGFDFAVIKLDSSWNIIWQKTYGGNGHDELKNACSDKKGGLVMGGYTDGFGAQGKDNLLIRIDSSGNIIKALTFGGDFDDEIASLNIDLIGNYIIQSKTNSYTNGGTNDIILIKTDTSFVLGCEFSSVNVQVNNASFSTILGATEILGVQYSNNETMVRSSYSFNENQLTPFVEAGPDIFKCSNDSITITAIDSNVTNISWSGGISNGVPFWSNIDSLYYVVTGTNYSCNIYDSFLLVIDTPINMSFSANFSSGCSPLNVDFTPTGNNSGIISSLWVFGDGDSSNSSGTVSHTYANTGCYDVFYYLENINGCVNDTQILNMVCVDSAHIEGIDTFLCLGDSMTLTAFGSNTDSLVGVYQLDMTGPVNVFTVPTIAGGTYYFKASGVWSGAGSCESRDPFYYFMNGCQPVNNYATTWKLNGAKPPKPIPLQYNPQHEYTFYFNGSGGQENLTFNDSNYGDNSGILTFELYHVYANYIWSTGDTTKGIIVKPQNDTIYYVTIDNGNCVAVDSFEIDVIDLLSSVNITDVLCHGENSGIADILTTGGNGSYTYEWPGFSTSSNITNNLYSGSYSITVTDNDYLCADTINILISQPNPFNVNDIIINVSCHSDSNGSINLNVSGNTAPYSYSWNTGNSTKDISQINAGLYTVSITDSNGCDTILSFSVEEPDSLSAFLFGDSIICIGDSAKIFASGNGSFFWPYNNQYDSFLYVTPEADTTYTLLSWDQNNCDTISVEWNVKVNPLPDGILTSDTSIIYGNSLTINSSSGITYSWSPDTGLSCNDCQNPDASPLEPTMYYLSITDIFSCNSIDSIFIDVLIEDAVYIANAFTPNMDGNNDVLYVHAYGFKNILFNIYNRWGTLVYSTNDPNNGWDGTYKNKPQESDIYVYVIDVEFLNGENKILKGDVTLIR